jgi:di/tricarboxylate transporter
MTWEAWFTIATAVAALVLMATDRVRPEQAMVGAVVALVLAGVVTPARALQGFGNEGMATVALLFVVAAAIRRTGALDALIQRLLGSPKTASGAQLRLMFPVAALSAFVNNTPLVAMLLPGVRDWARSRGIAPSRLLIPLSYAASLGGVCTLIGTSTNLIVVGLLVQLGYDHPAFFEVGKLGLIACVVGIGFVVVFGRALLPDREQGDMPLSDPRAFTAIFTVDPTGPLVGKRLGDVALPDLPVLNPIELERAGLLIPAPRPDAILQANDNLVVSAAVGEVLAIERAPGLIPVTDHDFARDASKRSRALVELVVSSSCPLIGEIVGTGSFRQRYDAAIIAIQRHGERVRRQDGGWLLEVGDTLLIEASDDFLALHRTNPDFWLVTSHGGVKPVAGWHPVASLLIFAAMVGLAASGVMDMFQAVLAASLGMLLTGILSWHDAQEDVNWNVLVMIASSFGLGAALQDTGAAASIAEALHSLGSDNPRATLALLYASTVITTEIVTNNAAAVINLPIGLAAAQQLDVSYMPFAMAVMVGASSAFATPIGYQTHMMVYGPGGYRFTDFTRIGLPLNIVLAVLVIAMAPIIWPF